MWEQQLMNDNLTNSKLEAADALGRIPSVFAVLPRLALTLRNHRLHPLVRSFAAKSLRRLHNNRNSFHAPECAAALLNYLYTYHYKQQASASKSDGRHASDDGPQDDPSNGQNDEGTVVPKPPPYWLTSEMIFLKDILTAVSRLRGTDGR